METDFVLLDFETTGLDPQDSEIIEIGAVRVRFDRNSGHFDELGRYHQLVRPIGELPKAISQLTGITREMLDSAPPLEQVIPGFIEFLSDTPIIAHNSSLEQAFLDHHCVGTSDRRFAVHNSIDPLALLLSDHSSHSMESMRTWAGVDHENSHRADKDCDDLLKILKFARQWMLQERPQVAQIVRALMPQDPESFWWRWFFETDFGLEESFDLVSLLRRPPLGDLKQLKARDSDREIDWTQSAPETQVTEALQGSRPGTQGFERRVSQEKMALEVRQALVDGGRVSIEAPTGTGKSVAYLLPGVLAARKTGAPLVVSTHSKALQDQLLEKDIPLVQKLLGEAKPLRATTVKGQENYLCLRKTVDAIESLNETSTPDERWAATYLASLASLGKIVELDRISHYVRTQHPALEVLVEQARSHRTTTIGPSCPFHSTCHFFDSARQAHSSDVVIANHSLVFQWPAHLPQIRALVFDEAHHLEDRITEAFSARLSSDEMEEPLDRMIRKPRGRSASDSQLLARLLRSVDLPAPFKDVDPGDTLNNLIDSVRSRLNQFRQTIPLSLPPGSRDDASAGYDSSIDVGSRRIPARETLLTSIQNLAESCSDLARFLALGIEAYGKTGRRAQGDSTFDLLGTFSEKVESWARCLSMLPVEPESSTELAPSSQDAPKVITEFLRLIHWNDRESTWRISIAPIHVAPLSEGFFAAKRAVILTSATLSTGVSPTFVTDRIGLKLTRPMLSLPSPYDLARQARVYLPTDIAAPGTPSHLESLIAFTEQMSTLLQGRTLLLLSSNRRLKSAAEQLRQKLEPRGISVIDSLTDRKAAEVFKQTERALLVGGERYGEGLDIPGPALSCVIVEKINEAMTRGPMAEARKARTRFGLYDYDFPLRMMWLKQRVGRLIRAPGDSGCVIIFDPRYGTWSQGSKRYVNEALKPMPIRTGTREQILSEIESSFRPGEGFR